MIYNYQEKVWYFGNLPRTAWVDRGINQYPIAASTDNKLYYHEFGQDDGSTNPSSAISSNIESSQMDLGEGDKFLLASKLIPDITFRDSENSAPSASFTVQVRQNPGINYDATSASTVTRSATTPVEAFTDEAFIRLRGRSFAIKVSSDDTGVMWRLGTPRIQLRPDGRR